MSLPNLRQSEVAPELMFFEGAPSIGFVFDTAGHLLRANATARKFTGCASAAQLSRRPELLPPFTPADAGYHEASFLQMLRDGKAEFLSTWTAGDGRRHRIRWTHRVTCNDEGKPRFVITVGYDLTRETVAVDSLQRSRDFTSLQARVNRALVQARDEQALLQEVVRLAVRYTGAGVAWFGRPDENKRFRVLASAGVERYLDGIFVSADSSIPEGRGPAGKTWRSGQILFNRITGESVAFHPWLERAEQAGLRSSASLPIRRNGRMWAVLSIYLPDEVRFDHALRKVLKALARDLSLGLDALDARRMILALTRHTDAAIAVASRGMLDYVNPRFAELFRAPGPGAMAGQSTHTLYADDATCKRIEAGAVEIERQGAARFQNVACRRQDGSRVLCDIIGTRLSREATVWTWIDVTARASQQRQIERLSQYSTLLAQVNHVITRERHEQKLLNSVCELAVRYVGVSLAWIGRPEAGDDFSIVAASGPARAYLKEVRISANPDEPEGQGPAGRVWRGELPHVYAYLDPNVWTQAWVREAAAHGLRTAVVLPIIRGERIWAVLTLYAGEEDIFDERLRQVLKELAHNISSGLDLIDLAKRERETSLVNALLLDGMNVGVLIVRYPDRQIEHANAQCLRMLGAGSLEEASSEDMRSFYPDDQGYQERAVLAERVFREGHGAQSNVLLRNLRGDVGWYDLSGHRLDRGDGVKRIIWTLVDVNERHKREAELRSLSAMRETLLSNTVVGIDLVRYPERVIIEANGGLLDILGYSGKPDEIIGKSADMLYVQASENRRMAKTAERALTEGSASLSGVRVRRRDGRLIHLDLHARRLEDTDPEHPVLIWTSVDVTERHQLAQELNRQALFDPLTGLPNRRALEQHLTSAITRARRGGTHIAVGMLDLDDFKPINDQFGHAGGDLLLKMFGRRVKEQLRDSDFVARIGGDEFVIVLEGIAAHDSATALSAICGQLHRSVEPAFDLDGGHQARIEISLGMALYPGNGEDPDTLLREADAAMYQVKTHKLDRKSWWRLAGGDAESAPSASNEAFEPFDPFGPTSRSLLGYMAPHLSSLETTFEDSFCSELRDAGHGHALLSASEAATLRQKRAEHLRFVLAPDTAADDIVARASRVGTIHALSGATPDRVARGVTLFGEHLRGRLERIATTARHRYRMARTADARLWLDMQTQLRSMQTVMDTYHAHTARPLPPPGSWASLAQHELEALAALPGIQACQIVRPDSKGRFAIEMSAGEVSSALIAAVHEEDLLPRLDSRVSTGHGLVSRAWHSGVIQRSDAYGNDERTAPWHALFERLGVRSLLALPVHEADVPVFMLIIEGAYINQFSPGWMQSFSASLEQRWLQVLRRSSQRSPSLQQGDAEHYRKLLHANGLTLFMQPVVCTETGTISRFEALARLITESGEVLNPGLFLPAFHDHDFHHLFRQGLEQSLSQLRQWTAAGIDAGVALNIAPTTLIHPECADWVRGALARHEVPADQLTLEVLETQEFDEHRHDAAIAALHDIGVRLAIDDLGSGYSSLRRLARLPVDVIKVDQALIQEMACDPLKTLTLLRTVILIGNDMERNVVVEGVENGPTLEAARVLGAHYAQGYHIARPMPSDQVLSWARGWQGSWRQPAQLQSYLGALAYYWRTTHDPALAGVPHTGECPLATFLSNRGEEGAEAARWVKELFRKPSRSRRQEVQRALTAWFVDKVRVEGRFVARDGHKEA